jgi:hypothetical protein
MGRNVGDFCVETLVSWMWVCSEKFMVEFVFRVDFWVRFHVAPGWLSSVGLFKYMLPVFEL